MNKIFQLILVFIFIVTALLGITQGVGKPWCKGRNYPGGRECCESEDPRGSKCTEGQGDCDSDAGCAGDLVCGRNNCRQYRSDASPRDDCCTTKSGTGTTFGLTENFPDRKGSVYRKTFGRGSNSRGRSPAGGKGFIPDVDIDLTKINPKTYQEHYGDGFRNFDAGSVSGKAKLGNKAGSISGEAKFGNNAYGSRVYAGAGVDNHGLSAGAEAGIEANFLGTKTTGSGGYQHGLEVDNGYINAETGVGAGIYSEVVPGIGVGVGIGSGLGVDAGLNREDKNLGLSAKTPVGDFGAHLGCKNKICIFACVTLTVC